MSESTDRPAEQQTLWPAAFLASPTRRPGSAKAGTTTATSGPSSYESLIAFDPDGSLVRTCLRFAAHSLMRCSTTWRRSATRAGRFCWRLVTSGHRTSESGCSSWPSPAARDWKNDGNAPAAQSRKSPCLPAAAAMNWPTPQAADSRKVTPQKPRPKTDRGNRNPAGPGAVRQDLSDAAHWPTPTANDPRNAGWQRVSGRVYPTLPGATGAAPSGPLDQENPNTSGKPRGSLNPRWVLQLQGFPEDWLDDVSPDGVDPA